MSARTTALAALIACRKGGAWSDSILKEYIHRDRLDRRDAGLASRLCYGTQQHQMLLDFYIASFLKGKLSDLQPVVLDILRLAVYQLTQMDKIPSSAAVNEAVEQTKKYANQRAAGLVNGLLRSMVRAEDNLPQPQDLATQYSHPQALVDLLTQQVGDDQIEDLLKSHNDNPPITVQVNPLVEYPDLLEQWTESGAKFQLHPWLPDSYDLTATGNVEHLPGFAEGAFAVQDGAAKLAVLAAGTLPGMQVLDTCAAPGGKSFAAAMVMKNQGNITSCDIHQHKMKLLEKGAERLGITILTAQVQDGSQLRPEWENAMDVVIADVPCSGLGVIRKKPDIRYKDLTAIARLPQVQAKILDNVASYVKPGGVLLYSTCTIIQTENRDIVDDFLEKHRDFSLECMDLPNGLVNDGAVTLLPHLHQTDGFFIAKLRRCL
ncbi:MAG: 16S rRNA (cytosine(967)-C(5))-methyltransferase RsmB [Eubacteriales bacterium]